MNFILSITEQFSLIHMQVIMVLWIAAVASFIALFVIWSWKTLHPAV